MAATPRRLTGIRVLVIEDEAMVAMLLEDMLAEIGCQIVGVAARYADAAEKARSLAFDVAILDLNLNGRNTVSIADALAERGVPFVIATGYGAAGLPAALKRAPILQKPCRRQDLVTALGAALT